MSFASMRSEDYAIAFVGGSSMARRGAISKPSPQVVLRGASGEVLPLIVERIKELLAEREARVAEHKLLTLHQKDVILD